MNDYLDFAVQPWRILQREYGGQTGTGTFFGSEMRRIRILVHSHNAKDAGSCQ